MSRFGPLLIALFAVSQAARDVYFGGTFQDTSPFVALAIAFSVSIAVCGVRLASRARTEFALLQANRSSYIAINVATAVAWSAYMLGLKFVQPSIVNTLHSAMGPLTALALAGAASERRGLTGGETVCYAGLAAVIVATVAIALADAGGMQAAAQLACALPLVSGAAITYSLILTKRLAEQGAGADALTALRYPLAALVALVALAADWGSHGIDSPGRLAEVAVAATVLIAVPLYVLQIGVSATGALTGHVVRALGPVFVFAFELADDRIAYSGPVLACVLAYCVFAVGANLARGWRR